MEYTFLYWLFQNPIYFECNEKKNVVAQIQLKSSYFFFVKRWNFEHSERHTNEFWRDDEKKTIVNKCYFNIKCHLNDARFA